VKSSISEVGDRKRSRQAERPDEPERKASPNEARKKSGLKKFRSSDISIRKKRVPKGGDKEGRKFNKRDLGGNTSGKMPGQVWDGRTRKVTGWCGDVSSSRERKSGGPPSRKKAE